MFNVLMKGEWLQCSPYPLLHTAYIGHGKGYGDKMQRCLGI